jgi:hypothetical protein
MNNIISNDARARARQNRSAQCSFCQGARALSPYRALSHNFSGIEVFIQKYLYESVHTKNVYTKGFIQKRLYF